MGEYAPSAIADMWKTIIKAEPDGRKAGIIGDRSHGSGYHRSRRALQLRGLWGDYSIVEAIDKLGDRDAASAIDTTFVSQGAQQRVSRRLMDACLNRDPRLFGMREWFGSLNSKTVTGYSLFRKRLVSSDSSHLWHVHVSIFRKFANDAIACEGIAEVMAGIPLSKSHVYHAPSKPVTSPIGVITKPISKTKKYKLRLTKHTVAYNAHGKPVKTVKKGTVLSGYTDSKQFKGDGRYFRIGKVPHRLWLPLDDKNFEHLNGTAVGGTQA